MNVKAVATGVAMVSLLAAGASLWGSLSMGDGTIMDDETDTSRSAFESQQIDAAMLQMTAVAGSLSDLLGGQVYELQGNMWILQRATGFTLVSTRNDSLTAFHTDGRPTTVARVEQGAPEAFIKLLEAMDCGCCPDQCPGVTEYTTWQECCNQRCDADEMPRQWCVCSAGATCENNGGVKSVTVTNDGGCSFECNGVQPK